MIKKETPAKKTCVRCEKELIMSKFYNADSDFFPSGKLHICKPCCNEIIDEKGFEGFQSLLRIINKPLYTDLYKGDTKAYITQVNSLPQYKNDVFTDSTLFSKPKETISSPENSELIDIDDEVISYWGNGYSDDEYQYLENEKMKLMTSFECPDYGMEMIMKDICFINSNIEQIRQERKGNDQKVITNLIETRSKLMNDANMKPIQSTGAEANDQVTFGTLIKKWENERPVPQPIDDEMKTYIDTFMVGHLAKMEGLSNDMTKKYDEALAEYTINFNDIHKDNEEFDE